MTAETNVREIARRDDYRDVAEIDLTAIERVVVAGDLSKLTQQERWDYYLLVCRTVGLNPATKPFEYLSLSGKLVLYAGKNAAEQLRRNYGISIGEPVTTLQDGLVIVSVVGTDPRGRTDSEIGAVVLPPGGEARANALMKAMTKAKRRLTLSMCGLGMLDDSEVDTIPGAVRVPLEAPADDPLICGDCGNPIKGGRRRDGTVMEPKDVAMQSQEMFGRELCAPCARTAPRAAAPGATEGADDGN